MSISPLEPAPSGDPEPSDDPEPSTDRPLPASGARPSGRIGRRVPPDAWPAIVAALGVVVAGLLLVVVVLAPSPAHPTGSPAAGAGSSPATTAPTPTATPAASRAAPTPSVAPTAAPSAPTAWPLRPMLPAGWSHELTCDDEATHCALHLRDAAGVEQPGWPVPISGFCWQEEPVGGLDGTAYVACDAGGRSARVIVHAVRLDGSIPRGWPVRLEGVLRGIEVAPNGTVYVGAEGSAFLHALGPDGTARSGWPRKLPEVAGGFAVAPDSSVVAWWYEGVATETIGLQARRTKYTTIAPNGRTRRGWPITSIGTASEPVVGRDGTVYYVSATRKVYGHDRRGAIAKGWPFQLRAVTWTGAGPAAPWLRDDGRLLFVTQQWDRSGEHPSAQATVLTTAGRPASGWPQRFDGFIDEPPCCTDCFPMPLFDVSADGTLFLAPWDGDRATVVALDADGRTLSGWPRRLHAGWMPSGITALPDGGVDITVGDVSSDGGACGAVQPQTVTLAADGSVVRDVGVSTLAEVYDALRPQRLRTTSGTATLAAGQPIELAWDLVNTARSPLVLPYAYNPLVDEEGGAEWAYLAGVEQMWIERLGPDPTIACVPPDGRRGTWYPWGGATVAFAGPTTVAGGGALERNLTDYSADCLAPGTYRFHLELREIGYRVEYEDEGGSDPLAATTLEFRIVGAPTTPSPRPTPSPTPSPSPSPRPSPSPSPTPVP